MIGDKVEQKLFQKLKIYKQQEPTQRCLHLGLSNMGANDEELEPVFETINRFFEEEFSQIHVCQDRDVFII